MSMEIQTTGYSRSVIQGSVLANVNSLQNMSVIISQTNYSTLGNTCNKAQEILAVASRIHFGLLQLSKIFEVLKCMSHRVSQSTYSLEIPAHHLK